MTPSGELQVAGRSLYEVVEDYAAFGNHWSGTQVDFATADWLVQLLGAMGGDPQREPWQFDRFAANVSLTCGKAEVPVVPVWYSAIGDHEVSDLAVVRVEGRVAGAARGLDDALDEAKASAKDGIVLVVDGPDDLPVQCNRVPELSEGPPAVIVPGNWLSRVLSDECTLRFSGAVSDGDSANVLVAFGPVGAPVVRLTTPLTGWTPAAGERGTGLAVALAMADHLADSYRIEFSACSGHELDHAGLQHHLASRSLDGEVAIHLGASVAAVESGASARRELSATRFVLTSAGSPARDQIADVVRHANFSVLDIEPPWPGEGGTWREAGASVLSFLGTSPLFHVTDDVPEKATTPEALQTAARAAIAAAHIYLESCFQ